MAHRNRIVIIGGTACGPKTAARARRCDPVAKITIIERRANLSTATCGLPYYISGVIEGEANMVAVGADHFRTTLDVGVLTGTEATAIDPQARTVRVTDIATGKNSALAYDKLVLATGASPMVFDWPGRDLAGIFSLSGIPDANAIRGVLAGGGVKNVVIVGAGLIGLEMAEAFIECGLNVTVIEAMNRVLPALLDTEMAFHVERHLESKGVDVLCGLPAAGFLGDANGRVRAVTAGNTELRADLVLLSLGVRPDVRLAKEAGLDIGERGGLKVDEFMRTSNPDIYAGGDCVEVRNLVTGQVFLAPMGSTANKHGRIIGTNVTGGNETFPGVLGTAIVKVFDINAGRVGIGESQARDAGYDPVTTIIPGFEHATYYPGAREIILKIIADRETGRLLGGQAVGTGDTAKRIDVLATAITGGLTVDGLANLDLSYAPPFNSAMDPVHNGVNVIRNKQAGLARGLTPAEVKAKLDGGDDFILLDVRSEMEWNAVHFNDPRVKLIPLPELRQRTGELPKDSEIIIYCRTSIRAYSAQRILDGEGFKDVKFLDGSLAAWPYGLDTDPR
ncbi:MAG: FAD-dependent oxidoreductase [Dehalococcoidales bacterium]|nr:FAD-dependent oxidoreductase [Dehalococcoidales bacterium]